MKSGFRSGKEHDAGCLEIQPLHRRKSRVILPKKIEQRQPVDLAAPLYNELARKLVHGEEPVVFEEDAVSMNRHEGSVAETLTPVPPIGGGVPRERGVGKGNT